MIRPLSLHTDVPADRTVTIKLPDETPVGPTDLLVFVIDDAQKAVTFGDLLSSPFFGDWADRTDIGDSADFARKLRDEAWKRAS